jgi:hypothetical protein
MKKNLEAAFARPHSEDKDFIHFAQSGMTLRDYFAAQALQGFLPDAFQEAPDNYPAKRLAPFWAGMAYQLADEMLKAREA